LADLWAALGTAEFARIVGLSLAVSVSATAVAALIGLPSGAALAISRFPGRQLLILLANAFLGLPPVVVGLALYLMLSRSGPLGALALLFTAVSSRASWRRATILCSDQPLTRLLFNLSITREPRRGVWFRLRSIKIASNSPSLPIRRLSAS